MFICLNGEGSNSGDGQLITSEGASVLQIKEVYTPQGLLNEASLGESIASEVVLNLWSKNEAIPPCQG